MSVNKINFNSDLAERDFSFYQSVDLPLIAQINSANIGCLYHGGVEEVVQKATQECYHQGVSIGAHISFLDKNNFGRTPMEWNEELIHSLIKEQFSILSNLKDPQISITHIKPHGALNNMACEDLELATTIAKTVNEIGKEIIYLVPTGSKMEIAAKKLNMKIACEIFADRNYEDDGNLVSRSKKNALITDPEIAKKHVLSMVQNQAINCLSGKQIPCEIDSVCIHGDNQSSLVTAKIIKENLLDNGLTLKPLTEMEKFR